MKSMILSCVLLLFVSTAFSNVDTNTKVYEGLVSVSKKVGLDGKLSYILRAASCAPYAAIAPNVEKISESIVIVKLELFGPNCSNGQTPRFVKFYLGTFEHQIEDLGLDPKNVTIFFNL